jgi:cytochrome c oxidase subunit II
MNWHAVNWRAASWKKVRTFLIALFILALIPATRFYQIDEPLLRMFHNPRRIDPYSLHVEGEFVENNLGTEQNADGSVTLRMLGQQYLFIPHCVLVPAGVPIHLRITSPDAVHSLAILGTDYTVKASPGNVNIAELKLNQPGEYKTACREFCGPGHYAMRSVVKVVPQEQFPALRGSERGTCEAQ